MKNLKPEQLKEFKSKINLAFRDFRKTGYFAKQNFWCCQSCAWSDVPEDTEKVVFYHAQDNDNLKKGNFFLAWAGNGYQIVNILKNRGLVVSWDDSEGDNKRINVKFK